MRRERRANVDFNYTSFHKLCAARQKAQGRAGTRQARQNDLVLPLSPRLFEEARQAFQKTIPVTEVTWNVKKYSIVSTQQLVVEMGDSGVMQLSRVIGPLVGGDRS